MRKSILIFLGSLIITSMSFAQYSQSIKDVAGGNQGRDITDLVCPDGSVYSQLPDGLNGRSYVAGYYFSDNVITAPTSPVSGITWWMLEATYYPNLSFDIFIHADNGGQPGTLVASFMGLIIPGVNTGEISYGYPVYEYTYQFPAPIAFQAGYWVGIRDLPDDGNHHHYWATSSDGDDYMWFGEGYSEVDDLAFCLTSNVEVPLSNWAIGIGIFLILVAAMVRLRKF